MHKRTGYGEVIAHLVEVYAINETRVEHRFILVYTAR